MGAPKELARRFVFAGKEQDIHTGLIAFGARSYDARQGQWLSPDPALRAFVQGNPSGGVYRPVHLALYAYAGNNPIVFFDPTGETQVAFHIRSFAPWKTFGGGFGGDSRSFTTSNKVTSRVQTRFEFDTETGQVGGLTSVSSPSHHSLRAPKTASPTASATASGDVASRSYDIEAAHAAANPLVPMSPDIDLGATLQVVEDGDTLHVSAMLHGDGFPNSELFIEDTSGQRLWLGAHQTSGGRQTGPISLIGKGDTPVTPQVNVDIQLDKNGNFVGVKQGNRLISVDEYNASFKPSE